MFFISLMTILANSYGSQDLICDSASPLGLILNHRQSIKLQKKRQVSDSFSPGLAARTLECHLNIDYLSDNAIRFNGGHRSGVT